MISGNSIVGSNSTARSKAHTGSHPCDNLGIADVATPASTGM